MKPWGQGDWKGVVLAGMISLGTSVVGWFSATIWHRYEVEQDMRRSREEDHRQLVELRTAWAALPVQALTELPARMSTLETALEAREPAQQPRRRKQ